MLVERWRAVCLVDLVGCEESVPERRQTMKPRRIVVEPINFTASALSSCWLTVSRSCCGVGFRMAVLCHFPCRCSTVAHLVAQDAQAFTHH